MLRSYTEQRLLRLEKLCATIKINYTIAFVMIGHQTYHLQEVEKPKYVRTKKNTHRPSSTAIKYRIKM